jgi:hypothetical protein
VLEFESATISRRHLASSDGAAGCALAAEATAAVAQSVAMKRRKAVSLIGQRYPPSAYNRLARIFHPLADSRRPAKAAVAWAGPLDPSMLVFAAKATDHHAEFVYDALKKTLYWDADGTGGAGQVAVAGFSTAVTLSSGDFVMA